MTRQGFTLIYAAALLVVLGMGLYMVTRYFEGVVTQDHYARYNSEIDRAEKELLSFLKRYRHLPRQERITDNVTGKVTYLVDRWETGLKPYFRPDAGANIGYAAPSGLEVCGIALHSFIPLEPPHNPPYQNPYFYASTYSIEKTENKFFNYRLHYCEGGLVGSGDSVQCGKEVFEGGNKISSVAFMIIHPGENLVFDTAVVANADGGGDIYFPSGNDDLIRYYNTGEIYSMMGCDYKLNQRPVFERRLTLGRPRGSNSSSYAAFTPDVNAYIGTSSAGNSGFPDFTAAWTTYNDDDYWNTDYPPFYRTYFLTMENMRNDKDHSYMASIHSDYSRGGAAPCHFQCAWVSVFRIHEYATCIYASGAYGAWRRRSGLSGQLTVDANTIKVPSPSNTRSVTGTAASAIFTGSNDTQPNCEAGTYRDTYHIEFPINRLGQDYDEERCCIAFSNPSVTGISSNCAIVLGDINGCINASGSVVGNGSSLEPGDFPYLRISQGEIPKVKGNRVFITNDVNGEPHHVQGKLIADGIRFNMEFRRGYLAHQIRADTPIVDFVP